MVKPSAEQIRTWLERVPDPEIPVISLVDLGVIRQIEWRGDRLHIEVAPTYSGCPATGAINADIETALRAKGIDKIDLSMSLSPPWTSDWLSDSGRRKLSEYGIAPPGRKGRPAACPHCGGSDLERISQFGSTPCKALWRCQTCGEPFDYFKCI